MPDEIGRRNVVAVGHQEQLVRRRRVRQAQGEELQQIAKAEQAARVHDPG
jgi:hypothetical protein